MQSIETSDHSRPKLVPLWLISRAQGLDTNIPPILDAECISSKTSRPMSYRRDSPMPNTFPIESSIHHCRCQPSTAIESINRRIPFDLRRIAIGSQHGGQGRALN